MSLRDVPALRQIRSHFHAMFDLRCEEREAALSALAASDPVLAGEVRRLLTIADAAASDAVGESIASSHAPGDIVGSRFRLVRRIGTGGMGEVYLAERCDEVPQRVAIKLIREVSPSMARRARRESCILARLTHEHIATLLDAGVTDAGEPWFAMEFVDGTELIVWCRETAVPLLERVRLFLGVCSAVHFAHANLVLHRDIKPSNLLVDARGVPKLVDFGVARLLDGGESSDTRFVVLSSGYAPPELLRGEEATTLSDVYQLGLVLGELVADAGRVPGALARADLDRIVARAAAADPKERYASAQALSDDLRRWLDGRPVVAHRGSRGYRLRRFLRRHAIAAASVAILAAGLLVATVLSVHLALAERAQRAETEAQRARAETTVAFLQDVFRLGDPQNTEASNVRARDLLDAAARKLAGRNDIDDASRGALMVQLATTFGNFGLHGDALPYAEKAVTLLEPFAGRDPALYYSAVHAAYITYERLGRYQSITDLAARALAQARVVADERLLAGLRQMRAEGRLGTGDLEGAREDIEASIAVASGASGDDGSHGSALEIAAMIAAERGDSRSAISLYERAGELLASSGADSRERSLTRRFQILVNRVRLGECAEAAPAFSALADESRDALGPRHPTTVLALNQLAQCDAQLGRYAQAIAIQDRVLEVVREMPSFNEDQRSLIELARWKLGAYVGEVVADVAPLEASVSGLRARSGESALAARAEWVLGEVRLQRGDVAAAYAAYASAWDGVRARLGDAASWEAAEIADGMGRVEMLRGRLDAALSRFDQAARLFEKVRGETAPATVRSRIHQAWAKAELDPTSSSLASLEGMRQSLVSSLGTEQAPQVWQLDLIIADLRQRRGLAPDPARVAQARAGLGPAPGVPKGLSSFS